MLGFVFCLGDCCFLHSGARGGGEGLGGHRSLYLGGYAVSSISISLDDRLWFRQGGEISLVLRR